MIQNITKEYLSNLHDLCIRANELAEKYPDSIAISDLRRGIRDLTTDCCYEERKLIILEDKE